MRRVLAYLSFVLLFFVAFVGCRQKAKLIPPGKLSAIYYEMFLLDNWLKVNQEAKMEADTTLVYEALFRSFGYNTDDFNYSIEHYLIEPERHLKIIETTIEMLKKDVSLIDARILEEQGISERNSMYEQYEMQTFSLDFLDSLLIQNQWFQFAINTDTLRVK